MMPSAFNAWKENAKVRQCFEIVFDTAASPPKHSAYVCKFCWEQFPADIDLMTVIAHAGNHQSRGESKYSSPRPSSITAEQVLALYATIHRHFEAIMPEIGTWKLQCRKCGKLLPHRSAHKDLMLHTQACAIGPTRGIQVTNPDYISQQMFDELLRDKFRANTNDAAVRQQASKLVQLVIGSQGRDQIVADIMHAASSSGHVAKEQTAVIAFCMGVQLGFELALSYPPFPRN